MKIFVTGGNGFIGSHVIKLGQSMGYQMIGMRRSKSPDRINFESNPYWVDGDLENDFSEILSECDAIIHLAAYGVNPKYDSWEDCFRWNVNASLSFFKQALNAGIKNFVIAGSCSEYGKSGEKYDYVPCTAPLEPVNAYGASKAAFTIAAMAFARENQIKLVVLRPFHIYGEGENKERFWPSLREAAINGEDFPMTLGEQIRDFTSVEIAAEKFIHYCTDAQIVSGEPEIYNLGTGKPMSLKSFAEMEWNKFSADGELQFGKISYRPNEVMRYVPKI